MPLAQNSEAHDMEGFIKPVTDKLHYKFVVLSNGLRALLVHDPDADKAAAAMDVRAGSLMDGSLQGLAHFTEHMLFYSSEKYPVEDEYSKFISTHGGHTNAFTALEDTNYQFDVNWDNLEEALDRFAQFFIAPLISADGVEREIKAVHSEHSKNINTDSWRQMQLYKHLSNPEHPWSRFSTGNMETLWDGPRAAGIDVRQAVVDFHAAHYSANLMRLAVVGRHSLGELEAMVADKFSAIPNKSLPLPLIPKGVFLEEHVGKLVKVVPQKQGHVLDLVWEVPPSLPLYRSAPLNYISHFLGHEGTGSVFSLLKSLGWATSLCAGEGNSFSSTSFFTVRMDLTDQGNQHVPEIIEHIYRYLAILRAPGGIDKQRWQEMRDLQHLRFTFREKQSPYSYVTGLSMSMQLYPDADLLLAMNHVPLEFDPAAISEALALMLPAKMRVCWASQCWEGRVQQTEPWYGTSYQVEGLPADWLERWDGAQLDDRLHLPEPNPFISTDFSLQPPSDTTGAPGVAWETSLTRLFHRPDTSFQVPKAVIYLDFQLPECNSSPENAVMTRLLIDLVVDGLTELAYPAELAGLYYDVQNMLTGFQVVAAGYNHKLVALLEAILDMALKHEVNPDRFKIVSEKLARDYSNSKFQQPYQWALYKKGVLMNLRRWTVDEYQAILPTITAQQLAAFLPRLFARCHVDGLVVGNISSSEVTQLGAHLDGLLAQGPYPSGPTFPSQAKDLRVLKLPQGRTARMREDGPNPANDNSAMLEVFQVGLDNLARNALLDVLVQLGSRDAFHQLRTVEQLGYAVFMFATQDQAAHSVAFLVQSNAHSAEYCAGRVAAFLPKLRSTLHALTDPELSKAKEEAAKARLEKPKNLNEAASRLWSEIMQATFIFDRHAREAELIRSITKQQLMDFADEVLFDHSKRRKLSMHIQGSAERTRGAEDPTARAPAAADADAPPAATKSEAATTDAPAAANAPAANAAAAAAAAEEEVPTSNGDAATAPAAAGAAAPAAAGAAAPAAAGAAAPAAAEAAAVEGAETPTAVLQQGPEEFEDIQDLWAFKRSCEVFPSVVQPKAPLQK